MRQSNSEDRLSNSCLDRRVERSKHLESLVLVSNKWITLPRRFKTNSLPHVVHRRQVLDPVLINSSQHNRAFEFVEQFRAKLLGPLIVDQVDQTEKSLFGFLRTHLVYVVFFREPLEGREDRHKLSIKTIHIVVLRSTVDTFIDD